MRLLAIACALAAALAMQTAVAQPLPASLRSAGITDAQWTQAQGVIRSQAATLNLREDAIRTLAVEIFEGQPDLSFDACLDLIREGAQRLPQLVATARALDPGGDARLADLQRRAVAAAEAGRLREALALQDQYRAQYRRALERAVEQPMLNLAAADAAAGDTAFALGDYLAAAERYASAAETAPESAVEVRWRYRVRQAETFYQRGYLFNDLAALREAVRLYEEAVLPFVPRDRFPTEWATAQANLGWVRVRQGERDAASALAAAVENFSAAAEVFDAAGDPRNAAAVRGGLAAAYTRMGERGAPGALERAVAAYEAALVHLTRVSDPTGWATTQLNLGVALTELGELERAAAAFEAALTVRTRDGDPVGWATAQMNLGAVLSRLGQRGAPGAVERALTAFEAVLTVRTRETDPAGWARTQNNMGGAYAILGDRGDRSAYARAIAAFEAALTVRTREGDPSGWAGTTHNLAQIYHATGRNAEARDAAQRALQAYEQVGNAQGADRVRAFLAELPAE